MRTKTERFIKPVLMESEPKRFIRAVHTACFDGIRVETVYKSGSYSSFRRRPSRNGS
ncbi:hypothetical protein ACFVSW_15485 [Neobacillus sp. NPDC058068]|uniref:hypothetical protein n=1 Tax=Neobacillus sp. NPDC058068 TaxID=3346325 RepID=UPI0036DF469F